MTGRNISTIDRLLEGIPIPKMVKATQSFVRPKVENVEETLVKKLRESKCLDGIKPGWSVAITAGSRGIAGIPMMLRTVVREVKAAGGNPFLFPAMGSHGGATAEGQKAMLAGLGITEESVGAPIKSSMDVAHLGTSANGRPVYIDKYADEADAIIVMNRIKPHTSFRGDYESGFMKMITIGMGKQKGADYAHMMGFAHMAESIPAIGRVVIAKKNIICAVGIIENAYHETAEIDVIPGSLIDEREPVLLKRAWELYPRIYFDRLDVLILDEIGKNISGTGFDTNIIGRYHTKCASGGPVITRTAVLDLTEQSHGNANGIGIVDITTKRLYDKMDFEQTYPNVLTSTEPNSVKLPMVLKNDRQVFEACVKTCNVEDRSQVKLVRLKNTSKLDEIEISESLIPYANGHPKLEVKGKPFDLVFNEEGNLF